MDEKWFHLSVSVGFCPQNLLANLKMVCEQNTVTMSWQNANVVTAGATLWQYLGHSSKKDGYLLKIQVAVILWNFW